MVENVLRELGLQLPPPSRPVGSYVGFKTSGNQVFISGQLPMQDGAPKYVGQVGAAVSPEDANSAAQLCMLGVLGQLREAVNGDWNRVTQAICVKGFVNCAAGFAAIPNVINGASDLLVKVLGEKGKHARAAIGVASLPANAAVEVEAVFEIDN
ncbi:RidA family protein [uncultured Propionivibrio sp.]|uniref:RidA family protein n=1 Tax=uncultured Propionivibrio sp. TaxID=426737 RepID=UPI0029C064AA|nr:RidA family protein [uncultured Propionivibrio sp.]